MKCVEGKGLKYRLRFSVTHREKRRNGGGRWWIAAAPGMSEGREIVLRFNEK